MFKFKRCCYGLISVAICIILKHHNIHLQTMLITEDKKKRTRFLGQPKITHFSKGTFGDAAVFPSREPLVSIPFILSLEHFLSHTLLHLHESLTAYNLIKIEWKLITKESPNSSNTVQIS